MNNFSIRDIEMLSGIKAHTFRIWEQRHGLYFCKRKDSQHRYYDNDDLKAVLRIAYLYHLGHKISKIAHLSKEEIINLAHTNIDETNADLSVHQLIEATLDYDQQRFEKILSNSILRYGFERSIIKTFYPFMQKVGLLWVTEHLIPAQEHFSSSLIQHKIVVAIDELGQVAQPWHETVLIFAPEGEFHEIPLLIGLYLLKKHGIGTVYFGANLPLQCIEYYYRTKQITHFYLHLITNLHQEAAEYLRVLSSQFPDVKIIASGPAISEDPTFPGNVTIVYSINELVPLLKRNA